MWCRDRTLWLAGLVVAVGCGSKDVAREPSPTKTALPPPTTTPPIDAPALPAHQRFDDLATAIRSTVPADARVIGFGELHARTDRPNVRSALARFTEALPAFGDHVSDLVLETWVVDPKCGQTAVKATKRLETEVKRPEATKNEVTLLAEAARAAKIQPHAMTLACADFKAIAPEKGDVDPIAMLTLTTKELTRIGKSAIAYRDKQPDHRPWITLYGGALHNDRFPPAGTAEWSYAPAIDQASANHYVEIDLIVPELAEAAKGSATEPWFPLVAAADKVLVYQRGERSFVMILPRAKP
ncbi:MAG TPA: hypothetical protein VFQ53_02535 [Kofleriaceae bacterium]|nr:hypothetical protein [Kofleriaceae bacterium]